MRLAVVIAQKVGHTSGGAAVFVRKSQRYGHCQVIYAVAGSSCRAAGVGADMQMAEIFRRKKKRKPEMNCSCR